MELVLYGALFYVWLCVVRAPAHASVYGRRRLTGGTNRRAAGLRLLDLRPSAITGIAAGLPFALTDRGVRAERPEPRFRPPPLERRARVVSFEEVREARASGPLLVIGGAPFARAVSAREARRKAALLRALGRATPDARAGLLAAEIDASLDGPAVRETWRRVRRGTRWLARACDLCLVAVFAGIPLAVFTLHEERALALVAPAIGAAHVLALWALWRGLERVWPEGREDRWEVMLSAALFPPSLWRARCELARAALERFHPSAIAGRVLERDAWRELLRRHLARLDHAPVSEPLDLRECERAALLRLAAQGGVAEEELCSPRARADATAASYCPVCHADYAAARAVCSDCAVPTASYVPEFA